MTNDLTDSDIRAMENCYKALMEDFTQYELDTDRKIIELEKQLEIKTTNTNRQIDKLKKDLPIEIQKVITHIEFAKPLDNK